MCKHFNDKNEKPLSFLLKSQELMKPNYKTFEQSIASGNVRFRLEKGAHLELL